VAVVGVARVVFAGSEADPLFIVRLTAAAG
jgi:hypothetical protein